METVIAKYKSSSDREIFFEPDGVWPSHKFVEAKKYMNSVFLKTGHFESYSFNPNFITSPSQEEKDMYIQLKDRSIHLIGKL